MFKRLRIAALLYVLAIVVVGEYLGSRRATDWDAPLWVDVYPVNGDGHAETEAYLDSLTETDFSPVEDFFAREAGRYGVTVEPPLRLRLAPKLGEPLPPLPDRPSALGTLTWSLRMRWFATAAQWQADRPEPDVTLFAVYHRGSPEIALDRSVALEKGLIAVANVFADRASEGGNQVVMAHELLHTLGATDKYLPSGNLPRFPDGYAEPNAQPLHPQRKAELMGGRIALDAQHAVMPQSLREVVIGSLTAEEVGW